MGGGSKGSKTDGGARESTGHDVQGGSSDFVSLWMWSLGCDRCNDDGDVGFT